LTCFDLFGLILTCSEKKSGCRPVRKATENEMPLAELGREGWASLARRGVRRRLKTQKSNYLKLNQSIFYTPRAGANPVAKPLTHENTNN